MFPCLFLVGVSLLLIPWTIHNFYIYGQLVPLSPRDFKMVSAKLHGSPNLTTAKERSIKASIDHLVDLTGHFGREFLHYWQLYPDTVVMNDPVYRENAHKKYSQIVRNSLRHRDNDTCQYRECGINVPLWADRHRHNVVSQGEKTRSFPILYHDFIRCYRTYPFRQQNTLSCTYRALHYHFMCLWAVANVGCNIRTVSGG